MVQTESDGFAIIEYQDGTKVKIMPDTKIVIRSNNIYIDSGTTWFKVEKQKGGNLVVKTPTAIAGIRGTEFLVNVENNGTTNFQLIEGSVEISDANRRSTMVLNSGIEVTITPGSHTLNTELLKINNDNKWWADWPTLVPISEMPGYTVSNTSKTNIGGNWLVNQDNGYTGKLTIVQDQYGSILGIVVWNESFSGVISGKVSGNKVNFTIRYPNGDEGKYSGTLTPDGAQIYQGSTRGNNGVVAGWVVSKIDLPSLSGKWDVPQNNVKPDPSSFYEDFANGLTNCVVDDRNASIIDGKLYWGTGNFLNTTFNWNLPMENVAIEFDAYCENNGMNIYLQNKEKLGYTIILGGWYNTRSGSDVGREVENRELVNGKVYVPKQWQHYKILRQGDNLTAYCNGRLIFQRNINTRFQGPGKLRFNSYVTKLGIDNVKVYKVQ